MFPTKILIASAMAAGSLAFAAQPASAATHIAVAIGCAPTYVPAPVVTYYTPAPVYYSQPTVVYAAPVCTPAPVVVYERRPDFGFRFNFGSFGHRGGDDHRDFRHDRDDHRDNHHDHH